MHRGLRPLGAGQGPLGDGNDGGVGDGTGKVSTQGRGRGGGAEGSKAAAQAVEGFIRKNIEAYFGCWTSTYTLFSLNPRLVRIFWFLVVVVVFWLEIFMFFVRGLDGVWCLKVPGVCTFFGGFLTKKKNLLPLHS